MTADDKVPVVYLTWDDDSQSWRECLPGYTDNVFVRQADHLADRAEWEQAAAVEANMADDLRDQLSAAQADSERLRAALTDLCNQIRKCNPIDDHGHIFRLNRAYCEAVTLLARAARNPDKGASND